MLKLIKKILFFVKHKILRLPLSKKEMNEILKDLKIKINHKLPEVDNDEDVKFLQDLLVQIEKGV